MDNKEQPFHRAPPQPGGTWERGRPARGMSGKRKTSENTNVFRNLTPSVAPGSRTSGSPAMLVQKVPRHFRGCGILPRRLGKWAADRPHR